MPLANRLAMDQSSDSRLQRLLESNHNRPFTDIDPKRVPMYERNLDPVVEAVPCRHAIPDSHRLRLVVDQDASPFEGWLLDSIVVQALPSAQIVAAGIRCEIYMLVPNCTVLAMPRFVALGQIVVCDEELCKQVKQKLTICA